MLVLDLSAALNCDIDTTVSNCGAGTLICRSQKIRAFGSRKKSGENCVKQLSVEFSRIPGLLLACCMISLQGDEKAKSCRESK